MVHIPVKIRTRSRKMAKEALLSTAAMSYGDDGILRIRILANATIGIEQVKLQYEYTRHLCGTGNVPVLVDARHTFSITREAQQYSAQQSAGRIATAVVTNNPVTRILTNTYVKIFKPASPVKMFSGEEEAVMWLKEKLAKSQNPKSQTEY